MASGSINRPIDFASTPEVSDDANNAPLGISFLSPNASNVPQPTFYHTLLTTGYPGRSYLQQIAICWAHSSSAYKMFYRVKDNGTWYEWKTIATS